LKQTLKNIIDCIWDFLPSLIRLLLQFDEKITPHVRNYLNSAQRKLSVYALPAVMSFSAYFIFMISDQNDTSSVLNNSALVALLSGQALTIQITLFSVASASAIIFQGHMVAYTKHLKLDSAYLIEMQKNADEFGDDELSKQTERLAKSIKISIEGVNKLKSSNPRFISFMAFLVFLTFSITIIYGHESFTALILNYNLTTTGIRELCVHLILAVSILFFFVTYLFIKLHLEILQNAPDTPPINLDYEVIKKPSSD